MRHIQMRNIAWDRPWLRHLGIAVAYAIVYGLLSAIFIAHWQLTAGFRLACLLLVPPRYWPALLAGEIAGDGKLVYDCMGELGLPWGLALLFAPMGLNMASVGWFRKYRPIVDAHKRVAVGALLLCIFAAIVLTTGAEVLEYALMQGLPPEKRWSAAHVGYFSYLWFLGTGLGIYMVVPLALWAYTEGNLHLRDIRIRIIRSRVLLEAVAFLLPCLYLLAYSIEYSHLASVRHIGQLAMLFTPVWFAMRYGWQGAALGCMLANLTVVLSMPALYDPTILRSQELMMVSSTLWLLLGARVSTVHLRHTPRR